MAVLRVLVVERDQLFRRQEGLVDGHIRIQRVLGVPGVGHRVAADDHLQAVPVQRVADRAVTGVDRRPRFDGHAVLLVDDLVLALEVELVDVDLSRLGRQIRQPGHVVPVVGLQEVFDRVLGSHLGDGAARPPDLQRDGATRRPTAGPQTGEITPVVRVQVGEKDFVQIVKGDHQRRHVGVGAGADVEDELVAVAELDQPAGRRLAAARCRHARSQSNQPDLVRPENLGARVVDVAVRCGLVRLRDRAACGLGRACQPAVSSRQTVVQAPLIDADHSQRHDQSDSAQSSLCVSSFLPKR